VYIKKTLAALILGGCAISTSSQATVITGSNTHTISGADSFVYAYNQATVNLTAGADVAFLDMHDQSHVNFFAGELSWLNLYEQSTADIFGGNLSWLKLHDQSAADIHEAEISWLLMGGDSIAHIYGSDFSYAGGHLSGKWADGSAFSFWALNMDGNGQIVPAFSASMPVNISLHSVPTPGTLYLIGAALLPLMGFHRKLRQA